MLTVIACWQTAAAKPDSLMTEHLGMWQKLTTHQQTNPALHGIAFTSSFSQLYLKAENMKQSKAFEVEKGNGFFSQEADVQSFLRLSGKTAVWGSAGYLTGKQKNIRWNSTSDFDLLKPYVLADSVGGDTRQERYHFAGGYATQLNHWLLGAEMLFRASQEYRDVDPRMRGVVNDLTIRLGTAYNAAGYHWAIGFQGNIYKQTNSVVFYRELGVVPEYQMTGLGTEYARFSGDKRTLYYKGEGKKLLLDVTPSEEKGIYGHIEAGENRYRRVLAELNSMPLTDMYVNSLNTILGWKNEAWTIDARFDYAERLGDEHIAGTSASTYFPTIGRRTMYKNHLLNTSLGAMFNRKGCVDWTISAHGGYLLDHERYVYPERRMEYSRFYGQLAAELFFNPTERLTVQWRLNTAYYANADKRLLLPYSDMRPSAIGKIEDEFAFAKANYTDMNTMVRSEYRVTKSYALFATIEGGYVYCSAGAHQTGANLSIGVTF